MFRAWSSGLLSNHSLASGAAGLATNLRTLMLPPVAPAAAWASIALLAMAAVGMTMALVSFRACRRARFVALAGIAPLVTASIICLAGYYPLLDYPRVILWLLPNLTLLLCLGLGTAPGWERVPVMPVAGLYFAAALTAPFLLSQLRAPEEENRAAIALLKANAQENEWIYVHGGVFAQFAVYEQILDWTPPRLYVGSWGWPCCAKDIEAKATNSGSHAVGDDVAGLLEWARGNIGVLAPSATRGHWSAVISNELSEFRAGLEAAGCMPQQVYAFGHMRVDSFECSR